MLLSQSEIRIDTTLTEKEDHLHGVYSRTWERLQKLVRTKGLTLPIKEQNLKYSTFGNGFHLFSDRKWVTAEGSTHWEDYGKDNEQLIFRGRITFYKRTKEET